jgi:ElaB/YqjD/DUF883 family membrane-anchored ribosome-binding protein
MKLALGKTCRELTGKTANITKDSAETAATFVRQNPWLAAGIAATLAVAGSLLARQRHLSRRSTEATAEPDTCC